MKWVLIVIGVLVSVVLIVFVVGKLLPIKHTVSVTKKFSVSSSKLWQVVRNFQEYDKWRRLEQLQVISETKWKETDKRGDIITFGIIEEELEHSMVVKILDENLPFGGTWVYEIESLEERSVLKITENGEVYNPIFRFISHFFMDQTSTINQYLNDLENHVQ